jgi:hypothetical protein
MADLGKMLVSSTGMAHDIFGHTQHPRSPLPSVRWGFDRVRRMKNHPASDEKIVWWHGWAGFYAPGSPQTAFGGDKGIDNRAR